MRTSFTRLAMAAMTSGFLTAALYADVASAGAAPINPQTPPSVSVDIADLMVLVDCADRVQVSGVAGKVYTLSLQHRDTSTGGLWLPVDHESLQVVVNNTEQRSNSRVKVGRGDLFLLTSYDDARQSAFRLVASQADDAAQPYMSPAFAVDCEETP